MARNDEPTTIPEILDMEPSRGRDKAWVQGSFQGVVKNAVERKGRERGTYFYICELEDPQDSNAFLEATSAVDFTQLEGQLVEVSGNGISREEYNRKPQVKLGKNAMVQVVGGASGRSDDRRDDRRSDPPARDTRKTATEAKDEGGHDERPYGPAVGNALEIAGRAISAEAKHPTPGTPEWAKLLLEVATDVYRVNLYMTGGHLADKVADRANPEAAAERKAEAAAKKKAEEEAERKAAEQAEKEANKESDPEEDDVPF